MISQRERGELARFYTVTDPKKHQKGYTVYKVTARIISRKNPEDVQEITVWKRYSDFRKLHRDLWQLHRNLCGQSELFPPFAKAKVFGRFEDTVIEERRQCSEDLLQFSANIPALYSSQHIQDFFKGGEVHDGSELIGPAEPFSDFLADSLSDCSSEAQKEISGADDLTGTSQSEYGGPSSDSDLTSLAVDTDSPAEPDDGMASGRTSPNQPPPPPPGASSFSFSSSSAAAPPTLSSSPLPVPGPAPPAPEVGRPGRAALLSLRRPPGGTPQPDYLDRAGQLIRLAAQREREQDYRAALACYHSGVDLLLQGVQGEPSPRRREAVKRCTAEYLMRAEQISNQHLRSSMGQGSTQTMDPGAQCVAPASRGSQQSPAEELSTYRVLGIIDKVLLVMDKRTQETFILKGLRKSSVIGRARRCVLPRAVPHMVRLSKFIVSEDTVFLLLRYAEGGKLWSHIGSFLRASSPEDSFDIPFIQKSHTTAVCSAQRGGPSPSPRPGSDSASSGSSLPGAAAAPAGSGPPEGARGAGETLTPCLRQRTGGRPTSGRAIGGGGGPGGPRPDSGATSEEECTNSYLALCNEYEQEKEEEADDGEEEGAPATAREAVSPEVAVATASPRTRSLLLSGDSLCSPLSAQELLFFTEATAALPAATDDAFVPLASKPELFSINSVDSAGEAAWCPDPASSSSSSQPRPLLSDLQPELAEEVACHESWGRGRSDGGGGGSDESVPVISFKEAAAAGEVAEVRPPDLLVNLPGVVGVAPEEEGEEGEEPARPGGACPAADGKAPPKLTQPDVLQRRHAPEGEGLTSEGEEPTSKRDARDKMAVGPARPGEEDFPPAGALSSAPPPFSSSGAADSLFADALSERLRSSLDLNRDEAASEAPPEPGEGEEGGAGGGAEADTSRLFAELDALSAAAAEARLPEELVQRWAAEMVSALDGLHREGVVCGDLNPNNILLTHQGHVELTYFCSWNEVEDSYDKEAVTNMYCAPEVGGISEETEACDWWSLGAILFELLTGKSLLQCHPAGISRHTTLNVPESVSEEAKSLLEQLLQFNPSERLGAGVAGAEDIKSHPFFARVDWSK